MDLNMTDKIGETLNLTPMEEPASPAVKKPTLPSKVESRDNDFEYARGNLYNIIERGTDALDGILELAQQSQHPRSYEVAAQLVRTLADTNKDLLELQKRHKELTGEDSSPKTINNNLFVGSTAELQKMIKQASGDENSDE